MVDDPGACADIHDRAVARAEARLREETAEAGRERDEHLADDAEERAEAWSEYNETVAEARVDAVLEYRDEDASGAYDLGEPVVQRFVLRDAPATVRADGALRIVSYALGNGSLELRYRPSGEDTKFDVVVDARHRDALGLLRQARPLQLVAVLLAEGATPMGELARRVGLSAGTLTYHVKRLEAVGVVVRRQEAHQRVVDLVDRDGTIALLLQYEPPADLVAGFEDLWQEVGF